MMIEPKLIATNSKYGLNWWHSCGCGFYRYDVYGDDFRLAVVYKDQLKVELVRTSRFNSAGVVSFYYYRNDGHGTTFGQIMDDLFESHPEVAEYFLFHLDELRK